MERIEKRMLTNEFIMFTNNHPDFGENMSEEETINILDELGLKSMFISSVNAKGIPRNYFLVSLEDVTETQQADLEVLIETMLDQRFAIRCTNNKNYVLLDVENARVLAETGTIEFLDETPENDYYVTPTGQVFNFPFVEINK